MMKKHSRIFSTVLITMVLVATASWATKKPQSTASMKPATRSETVKQNAAPVEERANPSAELVRLHNEWGPVRFAELSHRTKDRWVRAMFQGALSPERTLNRSLEIENLALRERIAQLEKEKNAASEQERRTAERFRKVEDEYEDLRTRSSNYLTARQESESLKSALAATQENMKSLAQENESLKISHMVKWTVIGAVILFAGWLAGTLMGRRNKKKRPSYHV